MTVGTVHYMAPEIGVGRYDKSVDIYALGIILYEMLSGRPPFDGESVGEILMKHVSGEINLSGIDEPFAAVIHKATAKDPDMRYQSAQEMAEAVFGVAHIRDSVAAFNPHSLSINAKRVGAKVPVAVGGPADSVLVGAESPVARARTVPWSPASHGGGGESTSRDGVDDAWAELVAACGLTLDHEIGPGPHAADPMPSSQRLMTALATSVISAAFLTLVTAGNPFWNGTTSLGAWMLIAVNSMAAVMTFRWARESTTRQDPFSMRMHSLLLFLAASALGAVALVILGSQLVSFRSILAIVAPMVILDWRAVCSPLRASRFSLPTTLLALGVGGLAAALLSANVVVAAAVAAVVVLCVQAYCPFSPPRAGTRRSGENWQAPLNQVLGSFADDWHGELVMTPTSMVVSPRPPSRMTKTFLPSIA